MSDQKQTEILFIGGSKDGTWLTVQKLSSEFYFPRINNVPLQFYTQDYDGTESVKIETETYTLTPLAAADYSTFVYVIKGLKPQAALRWLLMGYRKPKEDLEGYGR